MQLTVTSIFPAAAIAFAGAGAAPAEALAPGVYLDPGSPAGKQYAFPLQVLRGAGTRHLKAERRHPCSGLASGLTPEGPRAAACGRMARSPRRDSAEPPADGPAPAGARDRRPTRRPPRRLARALGPPPVRVKARGRRTPPAWFRTSSPVPDVGLLATGVLLAGLTLGGLIAAILRRG